MTAGAGRQSSSHWGAFRARISGDDLAVTPHELDARPSPLLGNLSGAHNHPARVLQPMVRRGWLADGPGPSSARGQDEFVRVDWPDLTAILATELERVITEYGNAAIFGGSYGWGSAGRFHHPQSQVHRFLNTIGGFTRSVNTYSTGASSVILPHVLGQDVAAVHGLTSWSVLAEHTTMILAFGGLPVKNMQVAPGGITRHRSEAALRQLIDNGTSIVVVSPVRTDCPDGRGVRWCPINPGTDVAMMLALAWVLITSHLHDTEFLNTRCTGYGQLEAYILGHTDGVRKDPAWAEGITGVAAGDICSLATQMAANRTFVSVTWSLQRAEHGEQPPWAAIALAAVLGQIGTPGGGFGHGYGSMGDVGLPKVSGQLPTLPQGDNPVDAFIPVARISDMLLNPGAPFAYNGGTYRYPHTRLVYWCGGNPFHHHQDIGRLRRAMAAPDTVVVHEPYWTATARHADIVVPSATFLERSDLGASRGDPCLIAMRQVCDPPGDVRTDYETFSELADALDVGSFFSEGDSEHAWLRRLYETWRSRSSSDGVDLPSFDGFWSAGHVELPSAPNDQVMLYDFVQDPENAPLRTPSGRIELTSATVSSFGYDDCPGHPSWLPPAAGPTDAHPLTLLASQPAHRLHSQLDMGATSQSSKIHGREPLLMHPDDAVARGIAPGRVVLITSEQGSCLAGAVLSSDIKPGCVQLATGAWYDPLDPRDVDSPCRHGNVNTLTRDRGTSRLAQGCTGQLVSVEVRLYQERVPAVHAHRPPPWGARPPSL
ncbi:molybdopterin-dependent oxidoreductase [Nonomuraea sp. B10E15]|uniref:molybdopterin-dependent oxidoreductase n=1 Tax=Nonomuraea sp. B10E15 TaxID=3153560 RepID=UPI00325F0674